MKVTSLFTLAVVGCIGLPSNPVDVLVESNIAIPAFDETTLLQIMMVSQTRSATSRWATDAGCLLDPGYCDVVVDTGGLGVRLVDLTIWLDVDGDDEGDFYEALADGDPIGFLTFDPPSGPLEYPLLVTLDEPVIAVEER